MITVDNIARHELIGMNTEIIRSSNPQIIGLNGRIIDETKSMIRLNTPNGVKSIAKSNSDWKFVIGSKDVVVSGSRISKRPFDRVRQRA